MDDGRVEPISTLLCRRYRVATASRGVVLTDGDQRADEVIERSTRIDLLGARRPQQRVHPLEVGGMSSRSPGPVPLSLVVLLATGSKITSAGAVPDIPVTNTLRMSRGTSQRRAPKAWPTWTQATRGANRIAAMQLSP